MKLKKLFIIAAVLFMAVRLSAQEKQNDNTSALTLGHGYRAFVEVNGFGDLPGIDISTTHGYQFNRNIFVGAGATCGIMMGGEYSYAHTDVRYDFVFNDKITPFADMRVYFNKYGVGLMPSIGYRYRHLNVSVKYWIGSSSERDKFFTTFCVGLDFGGRKR